MREYRINLAGEKVLRKEKSFFLGRGLIAHASASALQFDA